MKIATTSTPKLTKAGFSSASLLVPLWAFHEGITNAVIHRNYSVQDDIQVRFFDDRIEIESPGTYPGHITPGNIRTERYSRNRIIERTLNRFPSPFNLDIGEGVNRMFKTMQEHNLYDPAYLPSSTCPNSVLLILFNLHRVKYWDTVSKYIDEHGRITNEQARKITGIKDTLKMSRLLGEWSSKGFLEKKGGAKKSSFYTKPGQGLPPNLFSMGHENKTIDP